MLNVNLTPNNNLYKSINKEKQACQTPSLLNKEAKDSFSVASSPSFKGYWKDGEYRQTFGEAVSDTLDSFLCTEFGAGTAATIILGLFGAALYGLGTVGFKTHQFIQDMPEAKVPNQIEQIYRQQDVPHSIDVITPTAIGLDQYKGQISIDGNPVDSVIYKGESYSALPLTKVDNQVTAMDDLCRQIRPDSSAYKDLSREEKLSKENPGASYRSFVCLTPDEDITAINQNGQEYKVITKNGVYERIQPDSDRNDNKDERNQLQEIVETQARLNDWVDPNKLPNNKINKSNNKVNKYKHKELYKL